MNVKLLRKIQKHILAVPQRLDMGVISRCEPRNECGTAACLDGWAQILSNRMPLQVAVMHDPDYLTGARLLALSEEQAHRLFSDPTRPEVDRHQWPARFAKKYRHAKTPKTRAKIAAARIDHFIATKGAE